MEKGYKIEQYIWKRRKAGGRRKKSNEKQGRWILE